MKPLPIPDSSADAVCLLDTIEHLYDPRPLILEIGRILKPNGVFIGSVPFLASIHSEPDYARYTKTFLKNLFKDFKGEIRGIGRPEIIYQTAYKKLKKSLLPETLWEKARRKIWEILTPKFRAKEVGDAIEGYVFSLRK